MQPPLKLPVHWGFLICGYLATIYFKGCFSYGHMIFNAFWSRACRQGTTAIHRQGNTSNAAKKSWRHEPEQLPNINQKRVLERFLAVFFTYAKIQQTLLRVIGLETIDLMNPSGYF